MTMRFQHLRAAIAATAWAIMPDRLEAIAEVIERRVDGIRLSPEEIAGIKGKRQPNGTLILHEMIDPDAALGPEGAPRAAAGGGQSQSTVIAVLNVMGIIAQHAHEVDDISGPGGTSTERLLASIRAARREPSVKALVINIDSPGGGVFGVEEAADEIRAARGDKPIIAQVNSLAASAAYWIASAADEIVITPGGLAGSIGVYALHEDRSVMAEKLGLKYTFVSAGKFKVEGNALQSLGDEAHQAIQSRIDTYYDAFVGAVAKGRGVKPEAVRGGFGEGRVVGAKEAVKLGMADRIGTLDDTLRRLGAGGGRGTGPRALADVVGDVVQASAQAAEAAAAAAAAVEAEAATQAEADAAVIAAAAEADAFRRRRHAHRLRSA